MSQPVVLKSNPHGINLILDDRIPFQVRPTMSPTRPATRWKIASDNV